MKFNYFDEASHITEKQLRKYIKMNILDQWEAEAKQHSDAFKNMYPPEFSDLFSNRILSLIELVRKKDVLCNLYKEECERGRKSLPFGDTYYRTAEDVIHFIYTNLALTENLK